MTVAEALLLPDLRQRVVTLGVSGGIAAYKAAELCRMLVRCGAEVQVVMTRAAQQFVGEATFAALSGRAVATELFDAQQEAQIGHIRIAERSELLLLAPATANLIARMAHGLADDVLTTVYLAHAQAVLLAPAMNVQMWQHAATLSNVTTLLGRGHQIVGPDAGELACGHIGPGRMAEPLDIVQAAARCLTPQDLAGLRLLVSAGPTREALDPVRFIGNRSSGKMGYALAAVAALRGADVLLVSGPTAGLPTPLAVERVDVQSAAEMADAVRTRAFECDAVIMAAAVADFRPQQTAPSKLKKDALGETPTIQLARNDDILAALGRQRTGHRPYLVGFAAETGGDLDALARAKLEAKRCDLLVQNDVSAHDAGFEVDTNRAVLHDTEGNREKLPLLSKRDLAARILDRVSLALTPVGSAPSK